MLSSDDDRQGVVVEIESEGAGKASGSREASIAGLESVV